MKKNLKKAFTLVEMMIVVIIIGILMGALLPKLKWAQERARDTARKANLSTISTALQMYYNDNWKYPVGPCINDAAKALVPTYISDMPSDPQKWRTAFGTKAGWCTGWTYAYASMYRKWWKDAGALLLANVEAQGTVWNFVLSQKDADTDPVAMFSWGSSFTSVWGVVITSDTTIKQVSWDKLTKSAKAETVATSSAHADTSIAIWDASYAEKFTCSSVNLAPSVNSWSMCNRVNDQADWKAISNNSMVFIVFN